MFKKLLRSFAAKFLTLAVVMVAAAPVAAQAANSMSGQSNNLPLVANGGPTLKVGVNIPEGGYEVLEADKDKYFVVHQGQNGNCPKEGPYYTCEIKTLAPGGYLVRFKDVEGYNTPSQKPVQLNGFDDLVIGIYEKKEDKPEENGGPTLKVGVNIPEGGFEVLEGNGNNYTNVFNQPQNANCPVENAYYTCEVKTLAPGGYLVKFKDVEGYNTPSQKPVQLNGVDDLVLGVYTKQADPASTTFQVLTRDNQGNPLNEQYIRNALTTHTTPDTFVEKLDNLNSYSFEFKPKAGYTTPGKLFVNNKTINSIPANVVVTENGAAYAVGTALKPNATYRIIGTYVKQTDGKVDFSINKTVTNETLLNDGNKRVDYKLTVIRTNSGPNEKVEITVKDTISGNKKLYGNNGGVMEVLGNGTCSNGCGDITDGPVTIAMTKGQTVTLEYTLESDNSTIPEGEDSDFVNTVVGNFKDQNGNGDSSTDKETVTVDNSDDVYVSVNKQVVEETVLSDGNKEVDYRVVVKRNNMGSDSKVKVVVKDSVSGNKKLYGDNGGVMQVVGNGTCSGYNNCGDITDGPVTVYLTKNQTVTFFYTLRSNNSTIPAGETSYFENTAVANYEDGNSKDKESKDDVTVKVDGEDAPDSGLLIDVTADKSQAKKGECVLYTISATNTTSKDLTGLILTLDYDQVALDVTNTYGGTDNGSVVTWNHGDLDAGDVVRYQMGACVTNDVTPGTYVRTTGRALVNEIPNVPADSHDLLVVDPNGTAPVTPTPPTNTNSGMGHTLLLLLASAASYLVYQNTGRRRYSKLKAEALK